MERIKGLREYVQWEHYREALNLPKEVTESYELLGQGEYNINYSFIHPVSKKRLLLRVNCGSQMHLPDQIGYEYHALKVLEGSGRTPKAYYVDGSKQKLDYGMMVMEFLPGEALDYRTQLDYAAQCLADIHSMPVNPQGLIEPENPLEAILRECEEMFKVYEASALANEKKKAYIRKMLDTGWKKIEKNAQEPEKSIQKISSHVSREAYKCCINTELNSTNFLVDEKNHTAYLIDWEKPLYADPAQDLGHFLAPTTTFWKTDVLLAKKDMEMFLETYIHCVDGRFSTEGLCERAMMFMKINILRGITWCAMAWVMYRQADKMLVNESTSVKLEQYLDDGFLRKMNDCLNE